MRGYLLYLTAILLVICSCAPAPIPTVRECPALRHWSPEEKTAIVAAIKRLPVDSPLLAVLYDYDRLRAADAAVGD